MHYRRLNSLLLCLIIIVNGYIILTPLVPAIMSWWRFSHTNQVDKVQSVLDEAKDNPHVVSQNKRLLIPTAGVDTKVYQASYAKRYDALHQGVWHNPRTSEPDRGGNTVLAGHRFTYRQPQAVFFDLTRVRLNDQIGLEWKGKLHTYTVTDIRTVLPNDTSIEAATSDVRLTLYTCTPLFKPTDRLVIIAKANL